MQIFNKLKQYVLKYILRQPVEKIGNFLCRVFFQKKMWIFFTGPIGSVSLLNLMFVRLSTVFVRSVAGPCIALVGLSS